MKFNKKKIVLIVIAFAIFVSLIALFIPFSVGMHHGYDSAIIESTIEKNCKVKSIKTNPTTEDFTNEIKSTKLSKNFTMQLTDCNYETLNSLKQDILKISKENNFCEDRNIQFVVVDFKDNQEKFSINNCSL